MALKSIAKNEHYPDLAYPSPRREAAINAVQQLEAIFDGIIECARQQRGEVSEPVHFDSGQLPDIIRALAIRGSAAHTSDVVRARGWRIPNLGYRGDSEPRP
jgi:hypothetical protein